MIPFPAMTLDTSRLDTVLFDLDGTLIDHFDSIHHCCSLVAREMGQEVPSYELVRATVGGSIGITMGRLFGEHLAVEGERLYRHFYPEHWQLGLRLLPGARELLTALALRGLRCAVLTNKRADASREITAFLELDPLLAGVFGTGENPWRKPMPEFTFHALGRLGTVTDRAVLVGDSTYDIATAANAGLPCLTVATGTHSREALLAHPHEGCFADLAHLGREVFGIGVRDCANTGNTRRG